MKNAHLFFIVVIFSMMYSRVIAENRWSNGVVVLKDHTVINGEIKLNPKLNLLQLKNEAGLLTFTAFQVDLFYFHDEEFQVIRKYISSRYEEKNRFYRDVFFEEIIKGEVSLLRREKTVFSGTSEVLEEEVYSANGYVVDDFQYQHAMSFDYFYKSKDLVIPVERFSNDLLQELDISSRGQLRKFIEGENLNVHKFCDQIELIKFYNKNEESFEELIPMM